MKKVKSLQDLTKNLMFRSNGYKSSPSLKFYNFKRALIQPKKFHGLVKEKFFDRILKMIIWNL